MRCAEPSEGRPVYTREGHGGKWQLNLWWKGGPKEGRGGKWVVGKRADVGTKKGWLRLPSDAASPVGLTGWLVYSGQQEAWLPAEVVCRAQGVEDAPAAGGAPPPADAAAADDQRQLDAASMIAE